MNNTLQPYGSDNQRFNSLIYNPKSQFDPKNNNNERFISTYQSNIRNSNINRKVQDHFEKSHYADQYKTHPKEYFNENEFYKIYNEKLSRQFQEMLQQKGFSIYQKGLIQADKQHHGLEEILIHSENISPLMKALEDENKILKDEDIKRFISMIELLLDENKYIREHINLKNLDIAKIIETIGMNESEEVFDLKQKIRSLEEESNILRKHVDEMGKYKNEYNNLVDENEIEINRAKQIYQKAKEDLDLALSREETISKQLASIEYKYTNEVSKNEKIEDENEDLKQKLLQAENEWQRLQQENQHLQRNYNELTQKIEQDNEQLLQEQYLLQNELNEVKSIKKSIEIQLEHYQEENKKINKLFLQANQEVDEIAQKNEEFYNQIAIEQVLKFLKLFQSRTDSALQREKQMREKLDIAINEADKANLKLEQVSKQYKNLLESSKYELQDKHTKYEEVLKNLQLEQKQSKEETDYQIKELTDANKQFNIQLEKLQQETEIKTRDINDYKSKLNDYLHQKRIIDAQTLELKQQQNEINELNNLLNDYKAHLSVMPDSQKEKDQLYQQIQQLEEQCNQLAEENLQSEVLEENEVLKLQHNEIVLERDHLKQQVDVLKNEIASLRNELSMIVNSNLDARIQKSKQTMQFGEERSHGFDKLRQLQDDNFKLEEANMALQQQITEYLNQPDQVLFMPQHGKTEVRRSDIDYTNPMSNMSASKNKPKQQQATKIAGQVAQQQKIGNIQGQGQEERRTPFQKGDWLKQ